MDKQPSKNSLPTYSFYRRNCHHSHHNILCYLSSTTEIRVVKFDQQGGIEQQNQIKIPQQPVKGIRIYVVSNEKYYIGVAFISRFIVYLNNDNIYEGNLSLDCNISQFSKGFCGVAVYKSPKSSGTSPLFYFLFLCKNGHIIMFDPFDRNKILKTPRKNTQQSYEAFVALYPNVYLSTSKGLILGIRIIIENQHYEEEGRLDTKSDLPVLEMTVSQQKQEVYCGTAHGQIYIFAKYMDKTSLISAHHSLICRILVSGNKLYTFGEDCLMHVFEILGQRKLNILKTEVHKKLPSLLFKINAGNYLTFYESPKIQAI